MSQKWLKKGYFLILMTLLLAAPIDRSLAASFNSQTVIDLVNQERADRGIPELKADKQLSQAAAKKAEDMIQHNYFAHISPSGVTPWQWIGRSGYDYSFAGENLAINFTDPESQHQAFMKSETHKKNILNTNYQEIGVAVVKGKMNGKQTIITVQEFGTRLGAVSGKKMVAGITSNDITTDTAGVFDGFFSNHFSEISKIQEPLKTFSEKVSPVPFIAFLYVSSLLFALSFFFYELLAASFRLSTHFHFIRFKEKFLRFKKLFSKLSFAPANHGHLTENIKIYLTHMKIRR